MMRKARYWATGVVSAGFVCFAAVAGTPPAAEPVEFRITAPDMIAALLQFSEQSRLQLIMPTEGATHIVARRVEGQLTPRLALEELLRDSGLTFEFVNARTVSVSRVAAYTAASPVLGAR